MFLPLIIVGAAMTAHAVYFLVNKDVFGKKGSGKYIVEALRLSENAVRIISLMLGIIMLLIGLNFLIYGLVSSDPFKAFWFVGYKS